MQSRVRPTLTLSEAEQTRWDVVIVGAGPAGSMAARSTAQRGLRVLLLDREQFPRFKVCGCCVNEAALGLLPRTERAFLKSQGSRLHSYDLAYAGRFAQVPLSGGLAISRERLDSHLITAALESGAEFLDQTHVSLETTTKPSLRLKRGGKVGIVTCRVVVLATGLCANGQGAADHQSPAFSSRSYIGGGATMVSSTHAFELGRVAMACHRSGYLGMAQLEDGRLDFAAAFDMGFVKRMGGLSPAAYHVLHESKLPMPSGMQEVTWRGTAKLTRKRRSLFGANFLVVGDAAGYVEPFTGEGIAWAMAGGRAIAKYADLATTEPIESVGQAWTREYRRLFASRMRGCRAVCYLLRQPPLMRFAVQALQFRPQLAGRIEQWLSRPFPIAP